MFWRLHCYQPYEGVQRTSSQSGTGACTDPLPGQRRGRARHVLHRIESKWRGLAQCDNQTGALVVMAALRPYEKMPAVNAGAVLLIGSEESHRELLAQAMLREPKAFDVKIHMAHCLPLPFEGDHLRPRFDLVVFLINLHSQLSLNNVLSSMLHLDTYFYLGKICFVATRGKSGEVQHCIVDITTVKDLADKHLSILIQSELDNEDDVTYTAQRLMNILKICAGLVPGISSLYMGSVMKSF
ncbi:PREDICTED: centromere protein M [Nanorana parkeri]|uniref:centromere protein M n=1 Tax=Nanorana parkeri TaxID=125878 RepID=UPI0008542F21|nr:PREDICTED: centromere protein M [Nanorana parkeri]